MTAPFDLAALMADVSFRSWGEFLADETSTPARVLRSIGADGVVRRFGSAPAPVDVDPETGIHPDDLFESEKAWEPPTAETRAHSEAFQAFIDDKGPCPFVASDATEDSYRDIVTGPWKLKRFRRNPIMPVNHDYWSRNSLPTGTHRVRYDKANERLLGFGYFDDADPEGARVKGKYQRGVMSGWSVGFRPRKVVRRAKLPEDHPFYGERGYWMCDCELLEISAVTIPANPSATSQRAAPGSAPLPAAADPPDLRQLLLADPEGFHALRTDDPTLWAALGLPPTTPTHPDPPQEDFWGDC